MREDYQPFNIGNRFTVTPPGLHLANDDRIPIIMDRGAFGSGEHETTRSCIELLETIPATEKRKILDLGSGTAILTIAALRLCPGRSWCIDIEMDAIESGQRNCRRNSVDHEITHLCGTLEKLEESGFNLILANIYGDILLDVAEELVAKASSGALIILSGILWEYNFDVRQKYQQLGCKLLKNRLLNEFSTVFLQKL